MVYASASQRQLRERQSARDRQDDVGIPCRLQSVAT